MNLIGFLRLVIRNRLPLNRKRFKIGRHTYGLLNSSVPFGGPLEIGAFCSFADGVRILSDGDHDTTRVTTFPMKTLLLKLKENQDKISKGAVWIGSDVWVGMNAIILGGVRIGHGCIIGAGSVVTKDCFAYGIYAGNPVRLIRYRFDEETVKRLLKIRWWEWRDDTILERIDDFYLPGGAFAEIHREQVADKLTLEAYSWKGLHAVRSDAKGLQQP